jgi:hypothetical protein
MPGERRRRIRGPPRAPADPHQPPTAQHLPQPRKPVDAGLLDRQASDEVKAGESVSTSPRAPAESA